VSVLSPCLSIYLYVCLCTPLSLPSLTFPTNIFTPIPPTLPYSSLVIQARYVITTTSSFPLFPSFPSFLSFFPSSSSPSSVSTGRLSAFIIITFVASHDCLFFLPPLISWFLYRLPAYVTLRCATLLVIAWKVGLLLFCFCFCFCFLEGWRICCCGWYVGILSSMGVNEMMKSCHVGKEGGGGGG